ncbi:MAG: hypothetical protein WC384_07765 [Prolixibacteraceae bacterium]
MTDYLRFLFLRLNLYKPVLPILREALTKSRSFHILDLCSGSGGTIESIYKDLKDSFDAEIKITLSDLFPNDPTYDYLFQKTQGGISYINIPVDATSVPPEFKGFRTIFSGFHHFDQEKAKAVLKNALESRQGIAIFDGGNKSFLMILLILFIHPVLLVLCTPFFRPFRVSRLVFTYLIPIIPFCTVWDGVISILRLYTPEEMLQMAHEIDDGRYTWTSGKIRNTFGLSIAYLVGYTTHTNIQE